MWMLRVGKRSRWKKADPNNKKKQVRRDHSDAHDLGRAMLDLEPRPNENLSVYKADDADTADQIAVGYATTVRPRPKDLDFVLVPNDCLSTFACLSTEGADGAPFLRELHHEILGLHDERRRRQLAQAILAHAATIIRRVKERDLIAKLRALPDGNPILGTLKGEWPALLAS